jgi:hypothetical protein
MGEQLNGNVLRKLTGIAELEEVWGLKEGEVFDIMFRSDLRDYYEPEYS